jgi:hypothetical protein
MEPKHGAGNGSLTIAKGALPLVLFAPQGHAPATYSAQAMLSERASR